MGTKHTQSGFTIVEVMLVLAVTGLMLIGVFAGASAQISIQRYRDSVTSYQTYLKDQFSRALYVSNERDGTQACTAATVNTSPSVGASRGTSDCLVVGRYITTNNDGTAFTSQSILAYLDPSQTIDLDDSDVEQLRQYTFGRVNNAETYTLDWGSHIGLTGANSNPLLFTLAVIRSPTSGSLMTFQADGINVPVEDTTNPGNSLIAQPLSANFDMCVRNDAGIFVTNPLAVRIDAGASTGSAVEVPPESEGLCS